MRVAFLGCDDELLALAAALARDERFELVEAFVDGASCAKIAEFCRQVHRIDEWPALLGPLAVDVIVVGQDRDAAASPESLRRLSQLGIPLVLPHPVGGPLLALELDMIRRDSGAALIPYYPGCRHPLLAVVRNWIDASPSSPCGVLEQLVFERSLRDRGRESVLVQLTRDIGLMQSLLGPLKRVTAQGPAPEDDAWNNLNVQLAGDRPVLARWSVEPGAGVRSGRLVLVGSSGRVLLEMPDDLRRWRLDAKLDVAQEAKVDGGSGDIGVRAAAAIDSWDESRAIADAIIEAVHGKSSGAVGPAWSAVCRELELADAVELSLRKRRVIELHHETVTEEDTFKGLMSAAGCLLILSVPLVLIGAAIVEGLTSEPSTTISGGMIGEAQPSAARRLWPLLLAGPLIVFLLMQTLRLVFPAPNREGSSAKRET